MAERQKFSPGISAAEEPQNTASLKMEPAAPPAGFREAFWLFAGGGITGTLLIGVIAVYQWLAGPVPVGLAMMMALLLSAVIGFAYCDQDRRGAFLRGLGLWVLIALPTALWALAPVRAAAVEALGHKLPIQAQIAALNDAAAEVRASACVTLGTHNQGMIAYQIVESLIQSPLQGARCMQEVARVDPAGASRLASEFSARLDAAIRTQNGELTCRVAPHAFAIHIGDPDAPALPLTECAATSTDATMAACCAGALATHYESPRDYTVALGSPDELSARRRQRLFTALVPYAFPRIDASRNPLPRLETKLLRTEPGQQWVLALGCDSLLRSPNPDANTAALEAIAASQSCDAALGGERSSDEWKQICLAWAAQPDRSASLCAPINFQVRAQAVTAAVIRVHNAIGAMHANELEQSILRGAAYLQRSKGTFGETVRNMRQAFDPSNLPAGTDPRLLHAARRAYLNTGAYRKIVKQYADGTQVSEDGEVARKLLENARTRSWSEVKKYATPEQRRKMQPRIERARELLKNSDRKPPSSITNVLR
jgi:hypothetical protein